MKLHTALLVCSFLSSLFVSSSALALDCQNPQTQTDMNQCASFDLGRENKENKQNLQRFKSKVKFNTKTASKRGAVGLD